MNILKREEISDGGLTSLLLTTLNHQIEVFPNNGKYFWAVFTLDGDEIYADTNADTNEEDTEKQAEEKALTYLESKILHRDFLMLFTKFYDCVSSISSDFNQSHFIIFTMKWVVTEGIKYI